LQFHNIQIASGFRLSLALCSKIDIMNVLPS
jgi:hypothetical protein